MFKYLHSGCGKRVPILLMVSFVAIALAAVASGSIQKSYEPVGVTTIEDLGRSLTPCGEGQTSLPD